MVVAAHRRPIGNKGRGTLGAQNPSPKCGPGAVGRRGPPQIPAALD